MFISGPALIYGFSRKLCYPKFLVPVSMGEKLWRSQLPGRSATFNGEVKNFCSCIKIEAKRTILFPNKCCSRGWSWWYCISGYRKYNWPQNSERNRDHLVKFVEYTAKEAVWRTRENIDNAKDLVKIYEEKIKVQVRLGCPPRSWKILKRLTPVRNERSAKSSAVCIGWPGRPGSIVPEMSTN